MGQREDVQASLCREGHPDVYARRRLADEVSRTVDLGVSSAIVGDLKPSGVSTAASAVVLASDLRAPEHAHDWAAFYGRAAEPGDPIGPSPTEAVCNECGARMPWGSLHKLGEARQGWRARLANAERWLADVEDSIRASDADGGRVDWARLRTGTDRALAEVRSMLDDPGGHRDTAQCVREPSETCHSPAYCRENGCQL